MRPWKLNGKIWRASAKHSRRRTWWDHSAIFNIKGNSYRLIVRMVFQYQRIYIKEFLTHAEYDKGRWKKWL